MTTKANPFLLQLNGLFKNVTVEAADAGLDTSDATATAGDILKDKTAIFITHKLISVKSCDRIYVIQDGKITEAGTHDELMKKSDLYSELYSPEVLDF